MNCYPRKGIALKRMRYPPSPADYRCAAGRGIDRPSDFGISGRGYRALLAVFLLGVPLGATAVDRRQTAAPPDLILLNGSIYTVDAAQPRAEAMAVTYGRFSFVGSDAEARQLIGPQTRVIDLRGSMVLPGIIDSHIHAGAGEYYNRRLCNVRSFSLEEGYERLAACVRAAPPGDWVVDGAARQVLDAVAAARAKSPCDWCRHTLTHIQWIHPSDRARLKTLNVIANIQEGWLAPRSIGGPPGYDYVKDTADGPLGPARAASMYPYRPLHDAGARLSAGSDWFYTDENPWNDIEAGVTSRDPGDPDSGPMLPGYALDVKSLLTARTLGGAYQVQNERETGSIEVGKRADFVVIDRDILKIPADSVHETRVLMTFFDGKRVAGQETP
jgi:predicted amidohydrolase YtcJ